MPIQHRITNQESLSASGEPDENFLRFQAKLYIESIEIVSSNRYHQYKPERGKTIETGKNISKDMEQF